MGRPGQAPRFPARDAGSGRRWASRYAATSAPIPCPTSPKPADELFDTDVILLTAPMYNLTFPAALKTWVDRLFTDLRLPPGYYQQVYLHRLLVDICGLEQHDVLVELTLAPVTPQMAHLVGLAQASQANGLVVARELGAMLALGEQVALSN